MSGDTDWNEVFAEQKAARDRQRAERLKAAKDAAPPGKEPFRARRFEALYRKLNADDVDQHTPWATLLAEAEYDYYVVRPELRSLEELVRHLRYEQGWA